MNITERKFYTYVPAATNPEGSGIFEMVQDDMAVVMGSIASMLGQDLYDAITAAQDNELDPMYELSLLVERYICLAAFGRAIPSLDLVLTPTGFGVVSNANLAPASADRVARLSRQIRDLKEIALDDLLDALRGVPDWCEGEVAKRYFRSLIWAGSMVKYFGHPNEYRTKLEELSPSIAVAERELIHIISPELHAELTAAVRTNTATSVQLIAIDLCRSYIYTHYSGHGMQFAKGAIISFLDTQLEHFPSYQASSAYQANHYQGYENEQKDSCFFFG